MSRLGILSLAVVAVGALTLTNSAVQAADDGKALFESSKCNSCHSVSSAAIEATAKSERMRGPDLSTVEDFGEMADLVQFLKKEGQRNGKDHMMGFKGTDEELQAVLDWVIAQKAS